MINRARRPVLCLGGGIIHAEAAEEARAVVGRSGIPAVMTLMGLGSLPAGHPQALGMLGMHAARSTNMALQDCDLFIAAGARFDDRATGKIVEFCPAAHVIHMDIDPSEVSKLKPANISLVGDVRQSLASLLPLLECQERRSWWRQIEVLQEMYPMATPAAVVPEKPYGLILQAAALQAEGGFVATDVGKHQMWTAQVYPLRRPRQLLTSGGLGTMGFGLPAAIGAALANPGRQVVLFTGDGSADEHPGIGDGCRTAGRHQNHRHEQPIPRSGPATAEPVLPSAVLCLRFPDRYRFCRHCPWFWHGGLFSAR